MPNYIGSETAFTEDSCLAIQHENRGTTVCSDVNCVTAIVATRCGN